LSQKDKLILEGSTVAVSRRKIIEGKEDTFDASIAATYKKTPSTFDRSVELMYGQSPNYQWYGKISYPLE
jgi:zinc protease